TRLISLFLLGTATTETYTLSLHDALPICPLVRWPRQPSANRVYLACSSTPGWWLGPGVPSRVRPMSPVAMPFTLPSSWYSTSARSEEHTSELQSRENLVCRLLLEKKN